MIKVKDIGKDIGYVVAATLVVATFPISVPLVLLYALGEEIGGGRATGPVWTPPWVRRRRQVEIEAAKAAAAEEAHKKTYAYKYSTAPQE
jgi:hypothetical protein